MGKRSKAAKASLAAAFIAAGGTVAAGAQSAANPDAASVEGIISSYFGPLGLRDEFQHYFKLTTGFENFQKFWKLQPEAGTLVVVTFSRLQKVAPPPGFEQILPDAPGN